MVSGVTALLKNLFLDENSDRPYKLLQYLQLHLSIPTLQALTLLTQWTPYTHSRLRASALAVLATRGALPD